MRSDVDAADRRPAELADALDAARGGDAAALGALVDRRHAVGAGAARRGGPPATSPDVPDRSANRSATLAPGALHADVASVDDVRRSIATYGCALLPGVVDPADARTLRGCVNRAFEAFAARDDPAWFRPFRAHTDDEGELRELRFRRAFNIEAGSMWAVDSPAALEAVLATFERAGLIELLTAFFGERPAISMNKCSLRRLAAGTPTGDWHQDGSFMGGEGIRSLNVWLALSDCGVDAPGMDLVPTRLPLAATGTEGANFPWTVAPAEVERAWGPVPIVRPAFRAGDALVFDHRFLHRTAGDPSMTSPRHAIEAWFFPPSDYPSAQVPIAV